MSIQHTNININTSANSKIIVIVMIILLVLALIYLSITLLGKNSFFSFFNSKNVTNDQTGHQKSINPLNDENNRAIQLINDKNYLSAIKILQGLSDNHQNIEVKINLAFAYKKNNDRDTSLKILNQILSNDPNNKYALNNRGMLLMESNKFPEAETDFINSFKIDNTYAYAIFNLATLYEIKKEWRNALTYYKKYLSLYNDSNNNDDHKNYFKIPIERIKKLQVMQYYRN
ncbi:MAG: tetratricopeptide repeat protein [Oligoflexia bacterium]|nr:tetratricopeptide repeat protein [Oligoflexia bacterium]